MDRQQQTQIIRTMFQSAWRDGLLTDNPAAKVGVLKTGEANRRPFTLGELKAILSVATTEWRGMVLKPPDLSAAM